MFSVIRKNKELYPVIACVGFGCVLAGGYMLRMATQHPDAAWFNKRAYFPWNDVKQSDQKRFYSSLDYSKREEHQPKID